MKETKRYDFGIARLEVEGLPDISLGHSVDELGIILGWKLNLIGFPELEGKKEHLQSFIGTVLQYSRNYISGVRSTLGSPSSLISITPTKSRHQLTLRSTKEGVKPLVIYLDDAELIDLTKCFDLFKSDPKIVLNWTFPLDKPLKRGDLSLNKKAIKSFFFPFLGGITLLFISFIFLVIPNNESDTKSLEPVIKSSNKR